MHQFFVKLVVAAFVLLPAQVWAQDATIFPPDPASCTFTAGSNYAVLSWDGQNSVHCLMIPQCTSVQILTWDGTKMSCYPTGNSGAPTAAIPVGSGLTYVGPAAPIGPSAPVPASLTATPTATPPGG